MTLRQQIFQKANRVVLKIGTAILTDANQQIDTAQVSRIVKQVASLTEKGKEVVLVSSGAIGAGMAVRGLANGNFTRTSPTSNSDRPVFRR